MANRGQLRRRQTQQSSRTKRKETRTESPSGSASSASSARVQWLKKTILQPLFVVFRACLLGILAAASLSRDEAATLLFVVAVISMCLGLFFTFMSILRRPDETPVLLPAVHRPDGTVSQQEPTTVHAHDKKVASYFASELPALAMAAAWFYIWSHFRPAFLCYAAYLFYRFMYHPLFRIHLLKEPYCDEFERPFGGVPLFRESEEEPVKVVHGNDAFEAALNGAGDGQLVVVDFSAKWCGPCKAIAPLFKQMATELKDVLFLTVDVDVSQDVAKKMAISSIPTFILFKDGERLELLRGASPDKLKTTIQQHM